MNQSTYNQNKQLKLSTVGKVAVFMTLSGLSASAMANIQPADNQSQVHRENNVEILDIKAPNSKGLSHNKFTNFDVDKQGAVINNALKAGQSQVANKRLGANSLLDGKSASVILNEVVSKNPSVLLGQQEVFGTPADYVLANANGITCNDCGFINTPKASLVVGKSNVKNGSIAGFDVTSNNKLTTKGSITAEDTLNLIAPTVDIDGKVTAKDNLNVVMGHNKIDADGTVTAVDVDNGSRVAPTVLDGQLFGSMQAGSIRIHSTDKDASV
ncbi:MAG: filamentous hemagglutinin N-terminal domain-containing protein, partial [Moraxellaceae bacterium]|nr:filamentous hemagglutinin N-terminal domain-containing protein [Moraxellaceae bacterium]